MSGTVAGARRIVIYGATGSGKSTLAAALSAATGLPVISVDDLMWRPGWQAVPADEQRTIMAPILDGERWILDAAYSHWRDAALQRAELIIGMDVPRLVSLGRLVRRSLRRVITRETVCGGNRETLPRLLDRDSIIAWHFRSFRRQRVRMRGWVGQPGMPPVRLVRSRGDATALVDEVAGPRTS